MDITNKSEDSLSIENLRIGSSSNDNDIQIFVRTVTTRVMTIDITRQDLDTMTVRDLKKIIQDREGISIDTLRLIFKGKQIDNDFTLSHYKIEHQSMLQIAIRLLGGNKGEIIFN
jgi:hypothetical protein